ncbi:C20orf11-like protein [Dinothrombium tinctorium]|uniref:C20orf11-like protein n=1 Tax=Dinothrombium tinctorium TaxID=1965070 RepID=A0A3S4QXG8_9ACAR|nr:C20orf11-like protein [Dinothrombium tinctorium]
MEEWNESMIDGFQLKRCEINKLIMDYLVSEGFKEAAEKFKYEAGLEASADGLFNETPSMLDQRIEVRTAIEEGRVYDAISLINRHYAELLDQNRHLYFKLQQQQLIELIREQKVEEALKFSQEQLSVDEEFLDLPELERTLALLAFDKPENSPFADLLQVSHRQQLASEVNEAILKEQSGSAEVEKPHLVTLLKLLLWTQSELERKKIKFPKMTDLTNAVIDYSNIE